MDFIEDMMVMVPRHAREARDTEQLTLADFPYLLNRTIVYELFMFKYKCGIFFYSLFAVVMIIGVLANAAVIFLVVRHKQLRTANNYFITNLALTDIILLLILIFPRGLDFVYREDLIHSETFFTALIYIMHVCIQTTSSVLACMSISRYFIVSRPLTARTEWTTTRVLILCGICWIVSTILFIPILLGVLVKPAGVQILIYSTERKIFAMYRLTIMFVIPLFIITACYTRIIIIFRSGKFVEESKLSTNAADRERVENQTKKLTRMVLIVIFVFFFSWGPTQFYSLCRELRYHEYSPTPMLWKTALLSSFSLKLLAYIGSTTNPFIYAYTNPSFQKYGMFKFQKKRRDSTKTLSTGTISTSNENSKI